MVPPRRFAWVLLISVLTALQAPPLAAQAPRLRPDPNLGDALVRLLPQLEYKGFTRHVIGMSAAQTRILAWTNVSQPADLASPKPHILLVGGLDGSPRSVANVLSALDWFAHHADAAEYRNKYLVSAVAASRPEALRPRPGEKAPPVPAFPPEGQAYALDQQPEAHYLWRWIGLVGADLVIDVRAGAEPQWCIPAGGKSLESLRTKQVNVVPLEGDAEFAAVLTKTGAAETGRMLALVARWPSRENDNVLMSLLPALEGLSTWSPSPSRKELASRDARKPAEVARQLLVHYGRALPSVQYIPATALIARMRYGELTKDATHRAAVAELAAQAFAQPPKIASGGDLAGHLLLAELARQAEGAEREKLVADLRRAADLAFDPAGKPLAAMPFHNEMSDAVFMSGPLLAAAGRLTGEPKYHEACVRNIEFLHKLVLRPDGIYRHSPLDDAAWGRGNGFGALGLALVLSDLPANHAARPALLEKFRVLAARLKEFQDTSGMWRQVIDQPGAYRELTATCMIAYAFSRGVREGWLDREEYQPCVQQAWEAALLRIPENGRLVDVCTGTGKQRTLKDYLNRPALLQRDDRGGAMALLLAVEMAP